jgi:Penicillin amidase
MDAEQWEVAPYTEEDLERQAAQDPRMIAPWAIIRRDVGNYIAGINQYIAEAKLDTTKLLVRGGRRARAALRPPGGGACVPRLPRGRGSGRPGDRAARKFPYQVRQRRPRGVARPDPDSLREHEVVVSGPTGGQGLLPSLPSPLSASNALLVSGRESAGGHPLFAAGPQVSYFNPQILMEQDVHAPATAEPPGIDARGASFVGINLYVQLGRGRDYAWSATSAGQDNVDTFALDLCEPDGSAPTVDSMYYRFRGACLPIEVLERTNRWTPTPADQSPPGEQTLRAERTKMGLIAGRGTVRGKPVAFAKLPARGEQDRLHVQLVLRRRRAHRLLQLGGQPGARRTCQPRLPGRGAVRVARLGSRELAGALHRVRAPPARDRPALPGQLEQHTGPRLPGLRQRDVLVDVPLRAARGPVEARGPRLPQAHAAAGDRHHGARRDERSARARRAAGGAEGDRQAPRGAGRSGAPGAGPAGCGATTTATGSTSTPKRSASSTPGGRAGSRPSSSPCSAARRCAR